MRIVTGSITIEELRVMAAALFGNLVKGVVDVERMVLALDAELHSDLEAILLQNGSQQRNLWGINLYPEEPPDTLIEFDSMINVRPSQNNRTRGVEDAETRQRITHVIELRIRQ
jgi:hypothetical protein